MSTRTRTPAQLYALVVGAVLLLVGLVGFLVNASFATGSAAQHDSLLGFDINGWHNVVHLASGLLLLSVAGRAGLARTVVLAFGAVYALVTILGFIVGDGGTLLGLIPINTADNLLHLALAASALAAAFASPRIAHADGRVGVASA